MNTAAIQPGDRQQIGDFDVVTVVTRPPWNENCYMIRHRLSGAMGIVDPGGDFPVLSEAVKSLREQDDDPIEILLTHGHPDHIGALGAMTDALEAPCRAHIQEAEVIQAADQFAKALLGESLRVPDNCLYFDDGTSKPLAGIGPNWRAISTPGHTPGGVCYAFDGFAFTGDTLFCHGIGRTDLPGGDSGLLMTSVKTFLDQIPDETWLFSGHGPAWTAGDAKDWWFTIARQF